MSIQEIQQKYAEQTNREVSELDEYDLHICNVVEVFLKHVSKEHNKYKEALETIRDAFWSDNETASEKMQDLKSIAENTLNK